MSKRAVAFDMKAIKVDGQDVEAVYEQSKAALDHARSGKGPVFLRRRDRSGCTGHYIGDPQVYRSKEDIGTRARRTRSSCCARGSTSPTTSSRRSTPRSSEIVEGSIEFAKNGTDPKPEDALKNVYA